MQQGVRRASLAEKQRTWHKWRDLVMSNGYDFMPKRRDPHPPPRNGYEDLFGTRERRKPKWKK